MSNSSQRRESKILGIIAPADAEQFLLDSANLPATPDVAPIDLFQKGRHKLSIAADPSPEQVSALKRFRARHRHTEIPEWETDITLLILSEGLRKVWDAPDVRSREWYLFRLRESYHHFRITTDPKLRGFWRASEEKNQIGRDATLELLDRMDQPPPITAFEAIMFYFQRRLMDFAKHCGNATCPAPYFIATKKQQKFCLPVCAEPAQRESKRQWWRENRAKDRGGLL
jgi:hypothetical protein